MKKQGKRKQPVGNTVSTPGTRASAIDFRVVGDSTAGVRQQNNLIRNARPS